LSNLVIFDLDGVITGEDAYWDTAGLVLHELLYSPRYWNIKAASVYHPAQTAEQCRRVSRETFPDAVIMSLKARSVNSNWDTCYAGFCLYLLELLALVPDFTSLLPLRPADEDWIATLRQQLATVGNIRVGACLLTSFDAEVFQGASGLELLQRFNILAREVIGQPVEGIFARNSPSWKLCQTLFQEWYLGETFYTQKYGHPPAQPGKPGCIHFEQPLLPPERICQTLEQLRARGYTLGIATGRPGQEALPPLRNYGLLACFEQQHIVTDTQVTRAEAKLRAQGNTTTLLKPHPFPFLLAANPTYQLGQPAPSRGSFIVVGDTPSDVQGARAAGALTIAVLTGARTAEAKRLLEQSQPDFIVPDITHVPALLEHIDDLATIQRLQFSELEKAQLLLQRWFYHHMNLPTEQVTLTPKAVSLNSFNGVYRAEQQEYFFKTHVEEQGVLQEYYHAQLLLQSGYNIVRPLRTLHEKGQQMVIYPVVRWPVMFDLMREVELNNPTHANIAMLAAAEKRECERLMHIYQQTGAHSTAEEHAQAPIHQLFWHRLTGERLKSFYEGKSVLLPATTEHSISFEKIAAYRWHINGTAQQYTLGELIERAKVVLNPQRAAFTVIGHGDAHFGNVFLVVSNSTTGSGKDISSRSLPTERLYIPNPNESSVNVLEEQQNYLYFDPAFAGRHCVLLDMIKPLFHNIFATWMYFPQQVASGLSLHVHIDDATQAIFIEHNFKPHPVREAILQTKIAYLLDPLLAWLDDIDALPDDWLAIMQSALLCCPLLTINLFDQARMPAGISWLGLLYAVYMGNNGVTFWKVDFD